MTDQQPPEYEGAVPGTERDEAESEEYDDSPLPRSHRGERHRERRGRGLPGCLAVLLALVVVVAGLWLGGSKAYHWMKDELAGAPADYAGPGQGKVTFEVHRGDSATTIGRNLKTAGVVKSVDAFVDAATDDARASRIQVGVYQLKKQMKASEALGVLVNPKNQIATIIAIPEGYRAADIVAALAKKTKIKKARFEKVLDHPKALGLPTYADGKVEGYLFPATYTFGPKATPTDMLKAMVNRWRQAVADNDLKSGATALHYTPQQVMTVASLVQAEGKTPDDMAKIARVIYNRVEHPGTQGQTGRLQIDATVDYALGRPLTVGLTQDERLSAPSDYNTYRRVGLPVGPIGSPGDDAIQAALHPATGDWYYYVTVNLKTGETKFAKTPSEFQKYNNELREYCATQSKAC